MRFLRSHLAGPSILALTVAAVYIWCEEHGQSDKVKHVQPLQEAVRKAGSASEGQSETQNQAGRTKLQKV